MSGTQKFDHLFWALAHWNIQVMSRKNIVFAIHKKNTVLKKKHTLAQNNHCEFWCGMHLTCKNTPIIPDRKGSVKRPEKNRKGAIAIARARCKELEADPSLSTKPNRSHLDRLRKPCETRKLKTDCLETAWWFLGWPHPISASRCKMKWNWGRYVTLASQNDFTLLNRRLRWPSPVEKPQAPCFLFWKETDKQFTKSAVEYLTEKSINEESQHHQVEALHLFRCFTHTHNSSKFH